MSKSTRITFRRKVPVENWDLQLSVQRYESQPVWMAILMLAEENSGRASPSMVHEKLLLDELSETQATLLLARVVEMGLLDRNYHLTQEGRDALDRKLTPAILDGEFTATFVEDPLVPQVVLSLSEPHEARVDSRSLLPNGFAQKEAGRTEEIPEMIKDVLNKPILVNETPEEILIKEVSPYGMPHNVTQASLILECTPNNRLLLKTEGALNRTLTVPSTLTVDYNRALDILLEVFGSDWISDKKTMEVQFDKTDPVDRRTFMKTFTVQRPEIPEFGVFEKVETPPVRIEPKSESDAQAWFEWLLVDDLPNNYLRPSAYAVHVSKTKRRFPDRFRLQEPDQKTLALTLFRDGDTSRAWLLQAPLDLTRGETP